MRSILSKKLSSYIIDNGQPLLFLCFCFLVNLVITQLTFDAEKRALEVQVMVLYPLMYVYVAKSNGVLSLESIVLALLGLFCLSRLYLSATGLIDSYSVYNGAFGLHAWSPTAHLKSLRYCLAAILGYSVVAIHSKPKFILPRCDAKEPVADDKMSKQFFAVGSILMIVSLPFVLYLSFYEIQQVKAQGYLSIYTGSIQAPLLLRIARLTFTMGTMAVCSSAQSSKAFTIHFMMYMFVETLGMLKGGRISFATAVLFFFFYRRLLFGVKVRPSIVILFGLISIPVLQVLISYRMGEAIQHKSVIDSVVGFLSSNGVSINITPLYLDNKHNLLHNGIPYVFEPVNRLFAAISNPAVLGGQSEVAGQVRFNLSHQLSYYLNPQVYIQGGGLGNSFIAELSELGLGGVVLGSALLSWTIISIQKIAKGGNRLIKFMLLPVVTHLMIIARAEYFVDSYNLIKYFLMYFGVYLMSLFLNMVCKTCRGTHLISAVVSWISKVYGLDTQRNCEEQIRI